MPVTEIKHVGDDNVDGPILNVRQVTNKIISLEQRQWRRTAAADSVDLAIHAAAESLSMFPMGGGYSVRVDGVTFHRAVSPHALHPKCGCRAIPDVPE
jgi:hypothetical protein